MSARMNPREHEASLLTDISMPTCIHICSRRQVGGWEERPHQSRCSGVSQDVFPASCIRPPSSTSAARPRHFAHRLDPRCIVLCAVCDTKAHAGTNLRANRVDPGAYLRAKPCLSRVEVNSATHGKLNATPCHTALTLRIPRPS